MIITLQTLHYFTLITKLKYFHF